MREVITSPRNIDLKRKRKTERIRRSVLFSLLILTCVGALAYFSAHPRVTLSAIEVSGAEIIDTPDIEAVVQETLSGRYGYLFSRANAFIYPHDTLYARLIDSFPRIETLAIERTSTTSLRITITEREGVYLYCGTQPILDTENEEVCYFVNSDGYIFDRAPYFSGDVYFKFYREIKEEASSLFVPPQGMYVFSPDVFHRMIRFIDGVRTNGLEPRYLVVEADDTYALVLAHLSGATVPRMLFRDDTDLDSILENLTLAIGKTEFATEVKTRYSTLLYIDLRFKNKVLYKFSDE